MMRELPDRPPETTIHRFWNKVVKAPGTGCWIFTGAISTPDGYGRVNFTVNTQQYTISAHRFAMWIAGVDITDTDMIAEHRCNEPLCVRLGRSHLIESTAASNSWYAVASGGVRRDDVGVNVGGTDTRSRVQRSLDVRDAVRSGWDPQAYQRAARPRINPLDQPTLF